MTNPAVRLSFHPQWRLQGQQNPFISDYDTVWPDSNGIKIFGSLHIAVLASEYLRWYQQFASLAVGKSCGFHSLARNTKKPFVMPSNTPYC
jgi:hypothetical protein